MPLTPESNPSCDVHSWRQGDCVVGEQDFVYRIMTAQPLCQESRRAVEEDPSAEFVVHPVDGLMVVSQSCDIVRPSETRPFVEVAPLIKLAEEDFREVLIGARPRYVTVPGLHTARLAADLDRVQTVEKTLLCSWPRLQGCHIDSDRRLLGKQLARKRFRAALPDEFTPWFKPLRNRFSRLAGSTSADAVVFKELSEIRIQASPSWDAPRVDIFIWFVLKDEAPVLDRSTILEGWLAKVPAKDAFVSCQGRIVRYEDMTALEYIDSDPLDLDHMSPDEDTEAPEQASS